MKFYKLALTTVIAVVASISLAACSASGQQYSYTFGHEPEGYMSSNQPYNFDYCFNDLLGFKAEDGKSYAAFRDAGEIFRQYMESSLDEDGNPVEYSEEEIAKELETLYSNAVNNYKSSGAQTEDYTTNSGIEGKLIKIQDDLLETLATDFPVEGVECDNPVYYIFIAKSTLKTAYVYGDSDTVFKLISTYSYEGEPTTLVSDEEIEAKYSEIYRQYVDQFNSSVENDETEEDDTLDSTEQNIVEQDADTQETDSTNE